MNQINNIMIDFKEFYLSEILGKPIYDDKKKKIGNLKDVVVIWSKEFPQVVAIKFAGSTQLIPIEAFAAIGPDGIFLNQPLNNVRPVRPNEIFVNRWLLDKQIVDTRGLKVVRVNDIKMCWRKSGNDNALLNLIALDIGMRGMVRRLGFFRFSNLFSEHMLDWKQFQPLAGRTEDLQLLMSREELAQLHPADIADLLEDLNRHDQSEILRYLDSDTAADALAEIDPDTRTHLLENMDSDEALAIVQAMPPDEAADALGNLPPDKSSEILSLMQPENAQAVKGLMAYPDNTAGSIMTTEILTLLDSLTAQQAIDKMRAMQPVEENIFYVYVVDRAQRLQGVISLLELITAPPETRLQNIMHKKVTKVDPLADYDEILEATVKYNLMAVPVVNERDVLLGIITVDDVIETFQDKQREHKSYSTLLRALFK